MATDSKKAGIHTTHLAQLAINRARAPTATHHDIQLVRMRRSWCSSLGVGALAHGDGDGLHGIGVGGHVALL